MLTVGSLFSGIGGFDLGFERAGMRTVWFCEQDPFCQRVLAKQWPGVACYSDVTELARPPAVDLLCGGFPCQDISAAGRGAGLAGEHSGLWSEYARLVSELRPRYVVVENVAALLHRGLGTVVGDLAALGYDAEWDCLPASSFGAPHQRDRIWIVAYPNNSRLLADTGSKRRQTGAEQDSGRQPAFGSSTGDLFDHCRQAPWGPWAIEPGVRRVAYGVPARVDRLRSLGNALVPQIAEWIGQRIVAYEEGVTA